MTGKLKITGNILAAQKLQQLWAEEMPRGLSVNEVPEVVETTVEKSTVVQEDNDSALLEVRNCS